MALILGIESSCDETAAAVVDSERGILSNVVLSQLDEHRPYGGVVPEIAARALAGDAAAALLSGASGRLEPGAGGWGPG